MSLSRRSPSSRRIGTSPRLLLIVLIGPSMIVPLSLSLPTRSIGLRFLLLPWLVYKIGVVTRLPRHLADGALLCGVLPHLHTSAAAPRRSTLAFHRGFQDLDELVIARMMVPERCNNRLQSRRAQGDKSTSMQKPVVTSCCACPAQSPTLGVGGRGARRGSRRPRRGPQGKSASQS